MTTPSITAAICTYNRYDLLPKAIASLTKQNLPEEAFEIIVVDNSPDHDHSQEVGDAYLDVPNFRWVIEKTPGLSNARNVATNLARAPLIAFMDDDAMASPKWLEALVSAFEQFGAEAQVVGGRVDPIWGVPRPEWLPDSLLGNVSAVNWGGAARFAEKGEWIAGTNIAFRVDRLKAIEGFSITFGRKREGQALLSNDEVEVIGRIEAAGGRVVYAPEAVVDHLVPAERLTQSWFRRRNAWQAASDYLLDSKGMYDQAPKYWRSVTDFYALLPPRYRTPRGLYLDQDDPEMFRMQMSAIYNFTVALLSGFQGMGED